MDLPVVNHKDYFAKIGDDHKFPINKFGDLADFLLRNKIVTKFHKPYPCHPADLQLDSCIAHKTEASCDHRVLMDIHP